MNSLIRLAAIAGVLSVVSSDPSQCRGYCPTMLNDNEIHLLPHENCSVFCSCVHGAPVELPCPENLHFSPEFRECRYPSEAGCAFERNAPILLRANPEEFLDEREDQCFGTCPANDLPDVIVTLEHLDCGKFCKCVKGYAQERDCPTGFHFSPHLGVCTYPHVAQCFRVTTTQAPTTTPDCCPCPTVTTHWTTLSTKPTWVTDSTTVSSPPTTVSSPPTTVSTPPTTVSTPPTTVSSPPTTVSSPPTTVSSPPTTVSSPPTTVSSPPTTVSSPPTTVSSPPTTVSSPPTTVSTPPTTITTPEQGFGSCIGTCPVEDPPRVVHLPHTYCSKFCKCSHGLAYAFTCDSGLYFNPKLQVCDNPQTAGCTGIHA